MSLLTETAAALELAREAWRRRRELPADLVAELEVLGKRLRACLEEMERKGDQGSAGSIAAATRNRLLYLLEQAGWER